MESKQESTATQHARNSAPPITATTTTQPQPESSCNASASACIATQPSTSPAAIFKTNIGPSAAQAITAPRPPKSAADRLRELDLHALGYFELRVFACGELSRVDHAFSAAHRYEAAIDKATEPVRARLLRRGAERARQEAERIAAEALLELGVE